MYLHNNFSPIFGSKNLNYYQAILKETHSVVIEVTDRNNKDIAFSKFLIKKVLTPQEWGIGLSAPTYLTLYPNQPKSFTYLDYMFAWEGSLYYENSLKRYSWFLKFQFEDQRDPLPNWTYAKGPPPPPTPKGQLALIPIDKREARTHPEKLAVQGRNTSHL
ncbi:hypothetical protein CDL12_08032 [Handroanthus impetiginosus]|uniref:Uncharacterized protein n=1 Tax=Handroanthus impetiginosus TaxID=429701 RepID=A0A2G9HPB2_9LAMI|nr:hypothetical protein CDL12_08032 [Handroanthus impetiginosus]